MSIFRDIDGEERCELAHQRRRRRVPGQGQLAAIPTRLYPGTDGQARAADVFVASQTFYAGPSKQQQVLQVYYQPSVDIAKVARWCAGGAGAFGSNPVPRLMQPR